MNDEPKAPLELPICGRRGECENEAQAPHTCPFLHDVRGDEETLCCCCESCAGECGDEI